MKRTRFDDPDDLSVCSSVCIELMIRLAAIDYARRYFERKGDKSSLVRAKEIRKYFKHAVQDSVCTVRGVIPEDVIHSYSEMRTAAMRS